MTTKPSPEPWADEPCELLATAKLDKSKNAHGAVRCALQMAHAHNCLLRGLNSILQQAPCIPDASQVPGYVEKDVEDLLLYTEAWAKSIEKHHHVEEQVFFPELQKVPGIPADAFDSPLEQHKQIHDGITELLTYATATSKQPAEYRWDAMKEIFASFANELNQHLHDEIDVILSLQNYDSEAVWKAFDATEKAAQADASLALLHEVFPLVLGCSDKTYEGGNTWPELPSLMFYAIKFWFSRKRSGAWRFCPCDFAGQPRPLQMVSDDKAAADVIIR